MIRGAAGPGPPVVSVIRVLSAVTGLLVLPPLALVVVARVGEFLGARSPLSTTQATTTTGMVLFGGGALLMWSRLRTPESGPDPAVDVDSGMDDSRISYLGETGARISHANGTRGWPRVPARPLNPTAALSLELSLYLMVMLRMMWPVTTHLTTRFVGAGDAEPWMWQGWASAERIRTGYLTPWLLPDAVHPHGANLLLGDGILPMMVGTAWNLVVGNPVLAYNLTLMSAIASAMWAARLLAREVTDQRVILALCAVAYATAPLLHLRLFGHLNLMFTFVVPLVVREAVRWLHGSAPLRPVRLGFLLFVAYLSSFYFFASATSALVVMVSVGMFLRRGAAPPTTTTRALAGGLALCLVLMSPLLWMRIQHDNAERSAGAPVPSIDEAARYSADGYSILRRPDSASVPLPWDNTIDSPPVNLLESTTTPGYLLLVGLGGLLLVCGPLRGPVLVAAVVAWLASLGPALRMGGAWLLTDPDGTPTYWLPGTLSRSLPGLSALRAPNRFAFVVATLGVIGIAVTLRALVHARPPKMRIAVFIAAALLLATNLQTIPHWSDDGTSGASRAALGEVRALAGEGDSVLVVPADCQRNVGAVKLQMVHRTPEVGCPTFNAAMAWYSGLEGYESEAYAAWRCNPHYVGSRALDIDRDLLPDVSDIDGVGADLGVRFFIYYKAFPCDDRGRNAVFLDLLRGETYAMGEDRRWVIFDAHRAPDGAPRHATASGGTAQD